MLKSELIRISDRSLLFGFQKCLKSEPKCLNFGRFCCLKSEHVISDVFGVFIYNAQNPNLKVVRNRLNVQNPNHIVQPNTKKFGFWHCSDFGIPLYLFFSMYVFIYLSYLSILPVLTAILKLVCTGLVNSKFLNSKNGSKWASHGHLKTPNS